MLRYWKEKFDFKGYSFVYIISKNEAFKKTAGKNCFVIVAILWYSDCTLIHYFHNVGSYIMIFFSAYYRFILQLRKQIILVPKSDFFP